MTSTTAPTAIPTPRRLSRRARIVIAALAALVIGWLVYFGVEGECSAHSRYCVVNIAGTRSELGAAWDGGLDLYVSTWPEATTHSLRLF